MAAPTEADGAYVLQGALLGLPQIVDEGARRSCGQRSLGEPEAVEGLGPKLVEEALGGVLEPVGPIHVLVKGRRRFIAFFQKGKLGDGLEASLGNESLLRREPETLVLKVGCPALP
jgi:hypothetical protein